MTFSRREFLGSLGLAAVPEAAKTVFVETRPKQAWVILQQGWENNDEATYSAEGSYVCGTVYYDKDAADTECDKLRKEFFERETPEEFGADFSNYDLDEDATWEELCKAGFPDPYWVVELNAPVEASHE